MMSQDIICDITRLPSMISQDYQLISLYYRVTRWFGQKKRPIFSKKCPEWQGVLPCFSASGNPNRITLPPLTDLQKM